MKDICSGT